MIKKLIAALLIASVFAVPVHAAVRGGSQPIVTREGQTVLSNLALLGGPGEAPAYIMFQGTSAEDAVGSIIDKTATYYLWIGSDAQLRIASQPPLGDTGVSGASPPTTYWRDASGLKVGKDPVNDTGQQPGREL